MKRIVVTSIVAGAAAGAVVGLVLALGKGKYKGMSIIKTGTSLLDTVRYGFYKMMDMYTKAEEKVEPAVHVIYKTHSKVNPEKSVF